MLFSPPGGANWTCIAAYLRTANAVYSGPVGLCSPDGIAGVLKFKTRTSRRGLGSSAGSGYVFIQAQR